MSLHWIERIPWIGIGHSDRLCESTGCDQSPVHYYQFVHNYSLYLCRRHILARGLFSSREEQQRYDDYVLEHPEASYVS